jgi:uncharacterized protein YpuA (DUF1002 family)
MKEFAEFLQTFGGWGVSVVLLAGIIYLYRSTNKLLEKRNEQFIAALTETTKTLQQSNDESRRNEEVMRDVKLTLERVERRLER